MGEFSSRAMEPQHAWWSRMRCPYCQNPVEAEASECPVCRLSFPRTGTVLGAVPRLTPVVSDALGVLRHSYHRKLRARISTLESRFPGLVLQVLIHDFPDSHPFRLHVFRIFNAAAFAGEANRGMDNRAIVLAISPGRGEAALMPGYGLEPLLPIEALDHLLDLAGPAWQDGRWLDGITRVFDGLEPLLESSTTNERSQVGGSAEF